MRWHYDIKQDGEQISFHGDPVVTDELVIIGTDGRVFSSGIGHVYAFKMSSGDVFWKHSVDRGVPTDVLHLGANIFAVTLEDELICLDLADGRLKWSYQSGFLEEIIPYPSPAVSDSVVFFGASDGNVLAFDAASGDVLWKRHIGARISTSILILENDICLGVSNGHLYRLNQKSGTTVADFETEEPPYGIPTQVKDRLLFFLNGGSQSGSERLLCVDLFLKKAHWIQAANPGWSSVRSHVFHGNVIVGKNNGEIYAFRISDGFLVWSYRIEGKIRSFGSSGNILYVGTYEGMVYAVTFQ